VSQKVKKSAHGSRMKENSAAYELLLSHSGPN